MYRALTEYLLVSTMSSLIFASFRPGTRALHRRDKLQRPGDKLTDTYLARVRHGRNFLRVYTACRIKRKADLFATAKYSHTKELVSKLTAQFYKKWGSEIDSAFVNVFECNTIGSCIQKVLAPDFGLWGTRVPHRSKLYPTEAM
ncbi:hypothetical protein BCR43DRAFT_502869 [Syncephalastrum racemosum]|uniref:Uncharacterized protein n=1 Tax=Syncephalastrum racemosum TaxID=13706 RepID=A0A1X2HPI9_SYNRA|nr:hypothetical protein BCR43DRAFT_502869 [Syncephalastrum racemosum]